MEDNKVMFTWMSFFEELADKISYFRDKQNGLTETLRKTGLYENGLTDKDSEGNLFPMVELDPFTYFSLIMKFGIEKRQKVLESLKKDLEINSDLPKDFNGVPSSMAQKAWLVSYKATRKQSDIPRLWDLFEAALKNDITDEFFNRALEIQQVGFSKLTQGLFWIRPRLYFPIDSQTRPFLQKHTINYKCVQSKSYSDYSKCLKNIQSRFQDIEFYELSYRAWRENQIKDDPPDNPIKYWVIAPGEQAKLWEEFYAKGLIGIGWDYLGDLKEYSNKEDVQNKMREHDVDDSSHKNNALACFSFANLMAKGDTVFVKKGIKELLGYGVVSSDYYFDDTRGEYKHLRKVDWIKKGNWPLPPEEKFALKTLTDISKYKKFVRVVKKTMGISNEEDEPKLPTGGSDEINHWWLNANPSIWDFNEHEVGQNIIYTSRNKKGNKRRVYKYFQEAKPGDLILAYIASPVKEIAGICEVIKGLHKSEEGEGVEFKKIEQFKSPVAFEYLKDVLELTNCEPLKNNQGSLFKLSKEEYEIIREIIDEENIAEEFTKQPAYSLGGFSKETYLPSRLLNSWISAIERKGQGILYGPPGTGKTFIAERLAKHIIAETNGFSDLVQFHPSYSYEDFMQGIRPVSKNDGSLHYPIVPGRFLEFCREAQKRSGPCVLIIDEINRANLSRVFGELMYLLEYRKNVIPLASGRVFQIPKNVRIIGTMNTADRSIALVDHALRRRFAFISLSPRMEILREFHKNTGYNVEGLINTLEKLNNEIGDSHYEVGVSYFLHKDISDQIKDVWQMEIEPYLEEYFFDQPDKVEKFRWKSIQEKINQ